MKPRSERMERKSDLKFVMAARNRLDGGQVIRPARKVRRNMPEVQLMSKQDGKLWRAIGLSSGTSLDGIDIALIETDGEGEVHTALGKPCAIRTFSATSCGRASRMRWRSARGTSGQGDCHCWNSI